MATQNSTNTANPVTVAQGGTGDASVTAYAVLCGGTTTTNPIQSVSGVGTASQLLTSNGASALPTWQAAPVAAGAWFLIRTATASSSASLTFTSSDITASYTEYVAILTNISNAGTTTVLNMDWSTNNGSTYLGSGYQSANNSNPYNSNTVTNASSAATNPLTPSISSAGAFINGIMFLALPTTAAVSSMVGQVFIGETTSVYADVMGYNTGTTSINNIRFSFSSGNIASGTISLYGISS